VRLCPRCVSRPAVCVVSTVETRYTGAVNGRLTRCERPHCGGSIVFDGHCLLCGRNPDSPATVGTLWQRKPREARPPVRRDPLADLAARVFASEPSLCEVDPDTGAYVIGEL
jgi:hypothetical protein